jgi:hypothetical protein
MKSQVCTSLDVALVCLVRLSEIPIGRSLCVDLPEDRARGIFRSVVHSHELFVQSARSERI